MKTPVTLTVLAILLAATSALAFQQIRDGDNNLIGTRTKVGERYEIRDKSNNLVGQTNREGSRTIIRDGSGDQIGEIDRGSDD